MGAENQKFGELETRVRILEIESGKTTEKITNLIERMENLTSWMRSLVILLIPTILSAVGFLITYYIKG